jgi:peptidoglycan/xylan/chitin deacetylase (PgdA/CDA1 family)
VPLSTEHRGTNASSLENRPRLTWRELGLESLYRTGAIGVTRTVSRVVTVRRSRNKTLPWIERPAAPRFAVLCYHRVGLGGIPLYTQLSAQAFERQVRYLRKSYRILSLDELVREMANPADRHPAVAVTFDDGYRGLFTEAFPVLQEYKIPATIFLTIDCIETGEVAWYDRVFLALQAVAGNTLELDLNGSVRFDLNGLETRIRTAAAIISKLRTFSPDLRRQCCADLERKVTLPKDELRDRMLTWDQVRTMHRAGIDFGSHTMTHPVVSRLSCEEMKQELIESKAILEERLNVPVRHFAFPFGKSDECGEVATSMLAKAGYHSAGTTEWGLNGPGDDPFQLRRVQIGELGSQARFAWQLAKLFLISSQSLDANRADANALDNQEQTETQVVGR